MARQRYPTLLGTVLTALWRLCQSGRRRFHPHPRIKSGAGSSPHPEGEGIVDSTYQTDTDSALRTCVVTAYGL